MPDDTESPFGERFQLLIESGQATVQTVAATQAALERVARHYEIDFAGDEGCACLASHLAITLKRLMDGETLSRVPDVVWQELEAYPDELALAQSLVTLLEGRLGLAITRDELGFIAVHLGRIRNDSSLSANA